MNTNLGILFVEEVESFDGQVDVIHIGFIHDVTCQLERHASILEYEIFCLLYFTQFLKKDT